MSDTRPRLPLPYKIMLSFVVLAPVAGCFLAVILPLTFQKLKEGHAQEAASVVDTMAESVEAYAATHCAFPAALPRLADTSSCCGSDRCTPDPEALQAWQAAGIYTPPEPLVFTFETTATDDAYILRAITDFRCDPSFNHTYELRLHLSDDGCAVQRGSAITLNEFY